MLCQTLPVSSDDGMSITYCIPQLRLPSASSV